MPSATMLHAEPGAFALGSWRNASLIFLSDAMKGTWLERIQASQRELIKANPAGILVMIVSQSSANLLRMGDRERESAIAASREFGPHTTALAQVFEGSGFMASTLRSVLAGIQLIARAPHPSRVFGEIDSATRWLVEVANAKPSPMFTADALRCAMLEVVQHASRTG